MSNQKPNVLQGRQEHTTLPYDRPRVTVIGDAAQVILGVAGNGEDWLGYSDPEFEFERDNARRQ
jgi:hypothetical protein